MNALKYVEMLLIHSWQGVGYIKSQAREILTPYACKPRGTERVWLEFALYFFSSIIIKEIKRRILICAWKKHDACGHRPCGPWPRRHAWQGSGRTRSIWRVMLECCCKLDFLGGWIRKVLTASSLTFSAWRRLRARRWRLCCRRWGVTSLWILGALV